VYSGAGNDSVNLQGLTTGWTKQVTVRSAAGTDSVRMLDGTLRTISGTNATLTIPASSATSGGGGGGSTTSSWFDTNIHDAALKSLLKTDFSDNVLDRNEMLGVFHEVRPMARSTRMSSTI